MPIFKKRSAKPPKRDRRDVWEEVAIVLGGELVEAKRKTQDQVIVEYEDGRTLVLDLYIVNTGQVVVTYTRVKALFSGRNDFKLTIRKRSAFDGFLAGLGFGGIVSGDRTFAKRFVVKGHPAQRLRAVLTGGLVDAVLAEPGIRVDVRTASRKIRKDEGPDTRQVSAYVSGAITDPARILVLFEVVRATLDALEGAGLAEARSSV